MARPVTKPAEKGMLFRERALRRAIRKAKVADSTGAHR
jgi:hypothetical protein